MTRINSAIQPGFLTDEHLLAEHREIKRLPYSYAARVGLDNFTGIPPVFKLGKGHVLFWLNKGAFTHRRSLDIYRECLRRGFKVQNYSASWDIFKVEHYNEYIPSMDELNELVHRIETRIREGKQENYHHYGAPISKQRAIDLLYLSEIYATGYKPHTNPRKNQTK